ncbi:tRNA (uracil-5-)-methyltransferase [Trichophyton equinum CBS 127.97]|uniref:tRNA (Uracil-5-)-methyltransferase n=1 Tax=Trichophyton equinum (strain ATCC MYA-4606 / CBS 127.97) TaxID=559882 RepID=F2PSE3_TRIEC|nr:tRNA (uracil-5-)-methyltransferase [Trichophyton equinum CBS 127.97]
MFLRPLNVRIASFSRFRALRTSATQLITPSVHQYSTVQRAIKIVGGFDMPGQGKAQQHKGRGREPQRKKQKAKEKSKAEGGADEVVELDVKNLLENNRRKSEDNGEKHTDAETSVSVVHEGTKDSPFPETEVTVSELSSTGEGLALSPNSDHVYVVPFALPGETARVRIYKTIKPKSYSLTDLVEILKPSEQRDDSLIKCQYFGKCSGCQLQMIPYQDQLQHKKRIIEKAYANFSGLLPELIPTIGDTMGSPMQYGYRTKLTPHFTQPARNRKQEHGSDAPEIPPIGFMMKGRRKVMDIEDCPLGTDIVRSGLKNERKRVAENLQQYPYGVTLLVRESTKRVERSKENEALPSTDKVIRTTFPGYVEEKTYITDQNGISVEYVEDYQFHNIAGTFFQNNNSILPSFTGYVRDNALHPEPKSDATPAESAVAAKSNPKLKYLLDAYCGSGLFTIVLSGTFRSSLGIDVAASSIKCARENAKLSNVPNTGFAAADAAALFKDVPYPADQTLLVIDPPRKGCDTNFLNQLLAYGPTRVLYVSCNVHTQARDVGVLVEGKNGVRYDIESIRGFDFFPQTSHVESVAVLTKAIETKAE